MIKIDTSNRERWDYIEKSHSKYIYEVVQSAKDEKFKNLFLDVQEYIENNIEKIAIGKKNELMNIVDDMENLIINNITDNEIEQNTIKLQIEVFNYIINVGNMKKDTIINKITDEFKDTFYETIIDDIQKNLNKNNRNNINIYTFIEEYYGNVFKFYYQYSVISDIFGYKKFNNGRTLVNKNGEKYIWNRHALISKMGIQVCPYCNRQYITSYSDEQDSNKTTADLDHYFAKSIYPILALSLYNFVPSCTICNSKFKLAEDFFRKPHLYPYEDDFDSHKVVFTIVPDDNKGKAKIDDIIGENEKFKIVIENVKSEAIKNSIKTFKLEEVYQIHKNYVREIVKKSNWYVKRYRKFLVDDFDNKLFDSDEQVLELLYGEYIRQTDNNDYPLTKLTRDIYNQYVKESEK